MPKLWLKELKLNYPEEVYDIIQFGSSVFEGVEPKDIDIAVIFKKILLKEQLIIAQNIKKQIQNKTSLSIHVKSFDLYSFFDSGNFAKEGILFYGKSLISNNYFTERFGLKPRIQISYSLEKLEKKDKVRFHYMLKGKKGEYGLIKKYGGGLLKPGLIQVFPEYEPIFTNAIKKLTSNFEIIRVFIQE